MSTFFNTGQSKPNQTSLVYSFKNNKVQSKISKTSKSDDISPIDFYLKPINNENNSIDE